VEAGQAPSVPISVSISKIAPIHDLSSAVAARNMPVHVRGTITAYEPAYHFAFLQDSSGGICIWNVPEIPLPIGNIYDVTGTTTANYRTTIKVSSIQPIGKGSLPAATPSNFSRMISGQDDARYVHVEGKVKTSTALRPWGDKPNLILNLMLAQGPTQVKIRNFSDEDVTRLLGADIAVEGVEAGVFDGALRTVGTKFFVESTKQIRILHSSLEMIEQLPLTPLDRVMDGFATQDLSNRIRVRGTLTYYQPGSQMILEENGQALLIKVRDQRPIPMGSIIDATGFPSDAEYSPSLRWGQVLAFADGKPVEPKAISTAEARTGAYNYRLVRMKGTIVSQAASPKSDVVVLESGGYAFTVFLNSQNQERLPILRRGAAVEVTGVCLINKEDSWNSTDSYSVYLRTPADLAVLKQPSWWTVKHLGFALGALVAVIGAFLTWVSSLQRRVSKQTRLIRQGAHEAMRLGRIEARRSKVLEAINSSMPLDEVLTLIKNLVEEHVPKCACTITLGQSTEAPEEAEATSTLQKHQRWILSRNGERLGLLSLQTAAGASYAEVIEKALGISCNLAALAIENRRLIGDLFYRSQFDQLTGVPNRYLLEKRLQEAITRARSSHHRVGLVYIDLDFFKSVNDQYGHRGGDIYLQRVAERLQGCLQPKDTLARIGGDEFIVVLPSLKDFAEIDEVANRLRSAFETPFTVDFFEIRGTASIGTAAFPEDGESIDTLKRKADQAMYEEKRIQHAAEGYSGAIVTSEDLEAALHQRRFVLHYQPQCTKDGTIGSVEALIRLDDGNGNLIPPYEFIAVAEKYGLIVELGGWVLKTACEQLATWHKTISPKLTMVVNVSALQLQLPDYSSRVMEVLRQTGIAPSYLELELTESVMLENMEICLRHMTVLRAEGVHFSLDDFGTGYSSLSMVHRLPIDTIKIDRAFIQGLQHQPSSQPVIRSIMTLAEIIRARVIAEGVEEEEEVLQMIAAGCRYFQGFYFSKPLPAAEIEALLLEQRPARLGADAGMHALEDIAEDEISEPSL
jgi:diguanylate cyclase (GGDEF)-like protein